MKKICVYESYLYLYAQKNIDYCKDQYTIIDTETFLRNINSLNNEYEIIFVISNNHKLEKCVNKCNDIGVGYIWVLPLYCIDKMIPFINETGTFSDNVIKIDMSKPYIVHLETHINDHCNLNCKACNNFAPWVRERVVSSVDSLENDIKKLSSHYNIGRLFLLGGEPLLEEKLVIDSLNVCRRVLPDTEIRLLTNGLLVPKMSKTLWNSVNQNNIIIFVTQYPPTIKILKTIQSVFIENNVKYILGAEVSFFEKRWTKNPLENAAYNADMCPSSGCHYFGNGIISKCPDAATIKYVDSLRVIGEKSIINIDGINGSWELCHELDNPSDMCRYCSIERTEILPWEPIKKNPDIKDWLVEDKNEFIKKMRKMFTQFISSKGFEFDSHTEILVWGLGNRFDNYYQRIKDYMRIKFITDKNTVRVSEICDSIGIDKWDESKQSINNILCLITVDNPVALTEIIQNLIAKNIKHIHIGEWLEYVDKHRNNI